MPIYEYKCEKCENQFEMLQKITAEPLQECPECGGPVYKLISSTSFILKGGGWYATDYGKNRKPAESKDAATKKSPAKSEKKGVAKVKSDKTAVAA
ncbi:MAG TPA: zinc ribbon domain-containing protein [Desulfarculaceae bacterium]|nr:zinc ribbon domain-containing protein [Desulfarculaceae bacterium]